MNQIIKTYSSLFLMMIIVLVGAGLIFCALDAQKAEKINASYASTIAAHNYSDAVINKCKQDASGSDYVLTVSKYDTNADSYYDICECILEYDYSLRFLNSNNQTTTTNGKHHFSRIMK